MPKVQPIRGVDEDCVAILHTCSHIVIHARACLAFAVDGEAKEMRSAIRAMRERVAVLAEKVAILDDTTDHLGDEEG